MTGAGKPAQIGADLGQEHLGGTPDNTGKSLQSLQRRGLFSPRQDRAADR